MKPLALLPLSLLAVACFPMTPYAQQRPPSRNGEPYYPYGPRGESPLGPETGQFEPVPDGHRPPPPVMPPGQSAPGGPTPTPPPPPPVPAPVPRQTYPEAKSTANPNQVISPYAPYNVIDVEGFKSGALAKDPSNGKIFRVP